MPPDENFRLLPAEPFATTQRALEIAELNIDALLARVAELEAAIVEHRRLMAAGVVGEAMAVLRRVLP